MKITGLLSDEAILRELGQRLAASRLARNQTQATLAREAGVSKRTLERLESGEVATRLSGLIRVCRALGLGDRLDALVPMPAASPVAELRVAAQKRRRASGRGRGLPNSRRPWTWGDES